MARGGGGGRNRRPTRFADGSRAWEPSNQQEDTPPAPNSGIPQQEHLSTPANSTPEVEVLEAGTPDDLELQPGEQVNTRQLIQILREQQDATRADMIGMIERQQQQQQQFMQQQQQQFMQQQQQLLQHLLQQQQQQVFPQQQQGAGVPQERRITLIDFKKYAPPVFKGTTDPIEAEGWLKTIEKVFHALRCPAEEKINFATFVLQDEAADWWDMELGKLGPNDGPFTWEGFKEAFYEKYFPQSVRFQKFREFDRLEQGNMTVSQYAAKFEELSRYAPDLIVKENIRARKFENGLRGRIRQQIAVLEMPTYKDVVNKALVVERGLDEAQVEREKVLKKRSRTENPRGKQTVDIKAKKVNNIPPKNGIMCFKCGGPHLKRDCTWPGGKCYNCGREGHKAIVCPSNKELQKQQAPQAVPTNQAPQIGQQQGSGQQKQKVQGRVYALTQHDANASNSVVTGN